MAEIIDGSGSLLYDLLTSNGLCNEIRSKLTVLLDSSLYDHV